MEGFCSPRSRWISRRHRRRRCRPHDGFVAFGISRRVRRYGAGLHRGADQRKRLDAPALPLVSPLIDIMFAVGAIGYAIQKHFHPDSTDPASFHKLVAFFFAFLVIDFLASAIAFALERRRPDDREDPWLLSQVWLQRFAYRQLFSIVLFKTLKRALEGRKFAWDKLERTAAVNYVPAENHEHVHVP